LIHCSSLLCNHFLYETPTEALQTGAFQRSLWPGQTSCSGLAGYSFFLAGKSTMVLSNGVSIDIDKEKNEEIIQSWE
jgi:hypothetical protein